MSSGDPEVLGSGSTRCGRCAEILPDETLTYCLSCGVPFSRVPPTNDYIRFEERHFSELNRGRRWRAIFMSLSTFIIGFFLLTWVEAWTAGHLAPRLVVQRDLVIHLYDMPQYPTLDRASKREAVNVALQAFEDHFGSPLKNYVVEEDTLPTELVGYKDLPTSFTTWEKDLIPKFQSSWMQDSTRPLHVVVTNIPIFVDSANVDIETRHLSASKIISGLGHPGLVVVSAFRMLTEKPEFQSSRFEIRSKIEQARHLGEYLMAHELGHALVGLTDFVIEKQSGAATPHLRAPASIRTPAENSEYSQCLMHTDEAGGFSAWASMRQRTLGKASKCQAYEEALTAFHMRAQAITLLQAGKHQEAAILHEKAIDEARQALLPWVAETWHLEHERFLTISERWRNRWSMFQSKND